MMCLVKGLFHIPKSRITKSFSTLTNVSFPELKVNLRSTAPITKVAERKLMREPRPDHAKACSNDTTNANSYTVAIHAPECHTDPATTRKAIMHALKELDIKPLDAGSTDTVVILTPYKDLMLAALPDERVMFYYPSHDAKYTRPYQSCNISQSLHTFQSCGGILVTDANVFTGSETYNVIDLGSAWRDSMLRAVLKLAIITTYKSGTTDHKECLDAGSIDGGKIEKVGIRDITI